MTPTVLVNGAYLVSVKASILLAKGPDNMLHILEPARNSYVAIMHQPVAVSLNM